MRRVSMLGDVDIWGMIIDFVSDNVWEVVASTVSLVLGVLLQQLGDRLTRPRGRS